MINVLALQEYNYVILFVWLSLLLGTVQILQSSSYLRVVSVWKLNIVDILVGQASKIHCTFKIIGKNKKNSEKQYYSYRIIDVILNSDRRDECILPWLNNE